MYDNEFLTNDVVRFARTEWQLNDGMRKEAINPHSYKHALGSLGLFLQWHCPLYDIRAAVE